MTQKSPDLRTFTSADITSEQLARSGACGRHAAAPRGHGSSDPRLKCPGDSSSTSVPGRGLHGCHPRTFEKSCGETSSWGNLRVFSGFSLVDFGKSPSFYIITRIILSFYLFVFFINIEENNFHIVHRYRSESIMPPPFFLPLCFPSCLTFVTMSFIYFQRLNAPLHEELK